ncbi:MAG: hypothetical protein ACI3W8_06370 [Oscillospiraceae bacterium]
MIQRLCVCGERLWPALLHCKAPVYLPDQEHSDLRFLSAAQREAVLSAAQKDRAPIALYFSDTQDYIRFVLAYLLVETP